MQGSSGTPLHVAIIMDGNGRWAKKRGLPRTAGHQAGVRTVENTIRAAAARDVRFLTLYAFSTENWKRPETEVRALMGLFSYYLKAKVDELVAENVKLLFSGGRDGLPENIVGKMDELERRTRHCDRITLVMCINYGGRKEILDGFRMMAARGDDISGVTEEKMRNVLYRPEIPDPDLLIRTGGEKRLSNFLLWQSAYTELHFTDTLWPDFSENDLAGAMDIYARRERRYGGLYE